MGKPMPIDDELKDDVVLSIWQAITLVGDVRERSDEIEPSELETVLAEAESLLVAVVSGAVQRPGEPISQQRRGLRFWKAAHDMPSGDVSRRGSHVIPFPGTMISKASCLFRFHSTRAPINPGTNQPPLPNLNAGGIKVEPGRSAIIHRGVHIGWPARLILLVVMAMIPMLAIQAWYEHDLRNEREGVVRQRVVHGAAQLATEIGELREGARQVLLAIAQLEAVKLRQPEICRTLLAKLRSRYPNYSLLAAADTDGRVFCASGRTSVSVADQPFYTRAMDYDGLIVGNYWVDPANGQKMIHFAQQFDDSNGNLAGIVFAGLDLAWLSDHLKEHGLPPTSSKLITDREGNVIARLPNPEKFVGKNMRKSHEKIMDGGEPGWEEVTGIDGITRIFGYVPPVLPPKDFFLSVGESKAELFASIDSATWHGAALMLAGLLASICVAWAGRKFVRGPTQGLSWSTADQYQSDRERGARLATLFTPVAISKERMNGSDKARFCVRQVPSWLTGRLASSTRGMPAAYWARGPPVALKAIWVEWLG
jgi:hypothetical protein